MANIQVAIDGPAGSGKSSICKMVAERLNFTHIDTGALFRAITLYALSKKIDLTKEENYFFLNEIRLNYKDNKIYLNNKDVSKEIRESDVTKNVSQVSKIKSVRNKVLDIEREIASKGNILMDGRDIGSVVLPNAQVKIFLTASIEARALRRFKELEAKGENITMEAVLEDIKIRDEKDSTREIAPLKQASDAILVDTTNMTISEVCDKIIEIVRNKVGIIMGLEEKEITSMDDVEFGKRHRKGDIIEAKVVEVKDDVCYLDVNMFTEGRIYLNHFTLDKTQKSLKNLVSIGDTIKVEITEIKEEETDGLILCSRLKLLRNEKFKEIEELAKEGTPVKVVVAKEVLGDNADNKNVLKGYVCDFEGVNVFMPRSQVYGKCVIGDEIEGIFIEAEAKKQKAIFSSREYKQKEMQELQANELQSLHEGDIKEVTVVKIVPYAAFVKFDYVQAKLPLAEVSHSYINSIEDELHVNDKIEVKIIQIKNDKIIVSRKACLKTPMELFVEEHKVGDVLTGKVVKKLEDGRGLILEIAKDVKGLLRKVDYSHNPKDNYAAYVKLDDEIQVQITNIDAKNARISLSRKSLIDNPWSRVEAKKGEVTKAVVSEIINDDSEDKFAGLVVTCYGVDGFIPIKEALEVNAKGKLSDYYAVGDEVIAIVTYINPREWKLNLSINRYKKEEENKKTQSLLDKQDDSMPTIGDIINADLK